MDSERKEFERWAAKLHSEALLYAGKARTMAAKLFNDPHASQVDAGDLLLYMARLVDELCLAAAPAAPAPEPLMTGYLVRNKAQVAEAVAAFGPTKDLGYLWSYMHGADDIDATEACAHLEVVRLYSAPAAPAPAWQPIETAPKNCVDVLLNIPGRQPVVAAFYRGGWAPVDLGGNHLRGTPTHWMPLPEAPAIAASKESK